MEKKQNIIKRFFTLKVFHIHVWLLVIFDIALVASIVSWFTFSYDSRLAWDIRFPSQQLELSICSLTLPKGWHARIYTDHNGLDQPSLLFMNRKLFDNEEKFPTSAFAYTGLYFERHANKENLTARPITAFLVEMGAAQTARTVDENQLTVYRYNGPQYILTTPENPNGVICPAPCDTITIRIVSEFGFSALFWGLPDNEQDFWSMIDSIDWKR